MTDTYHHIERKFLKILEAVFKGHAVTLSNTNIKYVREGELVYRCPKRGDRGALETSFFEKSGDIWVSISCSTEYILSKYKKASESEISTALSLLSSDAVKNVDRKFLKVLEAVFKGHTVILDKESIKYVRKDDFIYDCERRGPMGASETSFFQKSGNIWIGITASTEYVLSRYKKASEYEIHGILASLSFDTVKRQDSIRRHYAMLQNSIEKIGMRTVVLKMFETSVSDHFLRSESTLINGLYEILQTDGDFPMDREEFLSINNSIIDDFLSQAYLELSDLTESGKLEYCSGSHFQDACDYYRSI